LMMLLPEISDLQRARFFAERSNTDSSSSSDTSDEDGDFVELSDADVSYVAKHFETCWKSRHTMSYWRNALQEVLRRLRKRPLLQWLTNCSDGSIRHGEDVIDVVASTATKMDEINGIISDSCDLMKGPYDRYFAKEDAAMKRRARRQALHAGEQWQDLLSQLTNERGPWGVGVTAAVLSARKWVPFRRNLGQSQIRVRSSASLPLATPQAK
jgi:hypothetical protein